MIPKVIHIISIPEHKKVLLLKNSYPSNNLIKKSNITVMTWDKKMIQQLLEKYPKIYSVYKNVDKLSGFIHSLSIQRLISSFAILKEYGGIYYETDLNCSKSVDKIFSYKEPNIIFIMKSSFSFSFSSFLDGIKHLFTVEPNFNSHFMAMEKDHPIWERVFPIIEESTSKYTINNVLSNILNEKKYPISIYDCEKDTLSYLKIQTTKSPLFWWKIFLFIAVIIIIIIVERINRYNVIKFNLSSYIPGITHPYPSTSSSNNSNQINNHKKQKKQRFKLIN